MPAHSSEDETCRENDGMLNTVSPQRLGAGTGFVISGQALELAPLAL